MSRNKLFDFDVNINPNLFEIGIGEEDLSSYLVNCENDFIFIFDPNKKRFQIARKKLYSIYCHFKDIYKIDFSLKYFFGNLGFDKINISNKNFKIIGILSFLRYFIYLIYIYTLSLKFAIVYGGWEGLLIPNLVFHTEKI